MCGIVCGVSSTLKEEEIKISLQKLTIVVQMSKIIIVNMIYS